MGGRIDYVAKRYRPLFAKTVAASLAQCMGEHFPRLGGPKILELCARIVLDHLEKQLQWRDLLGHGQLLYLAIDVNDPPCRGKTAVRTRLVPVILDLVAPEDIEAVLARTAPDQRLCRRAVRLCHQAYGQGGLLSNCDLAMLLNHGDSAIAKLLTAYENDHQEVVPRRATIHDVGSGLTHKRIICIKRYREGKEPSLIAKETHHSLEAVDRYLGAYDRVCQLLHEGLDTRAIAYVLACSHALVEQYVHIHDLIQHP
jgi:hypothetical protein